MSSAHRRLPQLTTDWQTVALVGLFVAFQTGVLAVASALIGAPAEGSSSPATGAEAQSAEMISGVKLLALAAVEITAIILAIRGYYRLPERWRRRIRTALKWSALAGIYLAGLLLCWLLGVAWLYVLGVPVVVWAYRRLGDSGLRWIPFNVLALTLGGVATIAGGMALAPPVIVLVMVAVLVYDVLAVEFSGIMHDLVSASTSARVPNFVVVPSTLRFELQTVRNYVAGELEERPGNLAFVIGVGDFVFPTLLVVSVFTAAEAVTVPVIATVTGVLLAAIWLRHSMANRESGAPALLWLNTGALGGYLASTGFLAL